MKFVLVPTDNSSILNNSSLVRKMPPTTLLVVTTPLVKKLSTSVLTESESLPINVLVSKVSSSSTLSVVVLVQVLVPSSSKDSQSTMVRSLSSVSPSILLLKSLLLLLSPTTLFSLPTPSSSTLMSLLCLITKLSTISAEETSILRDPPTLT